MKISQYADDSNFFLKNEESVKNTLNFFKTLNKATGTTINLEKTTILPINTDQTEQIQKTNPKITMKEQFETIKILGIYYDESLKNASSINWDNALEKMEKHINMLSPRILSLYGKTVLINTLILSKTSYISNVFPMNAEITNKIHNKVFTYLWKNKNTEPIARKAIHLKQKSGGLNLIEPEAHNYAMRIKYLLTLKQKEKLPSWKNLATYWLTMDIHNYTKEYNFLMNNDRTKTLNRKKPFYYNDIINYIKNQNQNIPKIKPETKIIYKKIIEEGSKQHTIVGERQWKKHIPNINFEKIWKNTYKSYGHSFTKDLHYRLLHYSTKTKMYMHKCSKDKNPNCDYCGFTEDNLYLFIQCTLIKNIWKHYQTILTKLTGQNYIPQQHLFILNTSNTNKNIVKLTTTIIKIILFEIWQSRNNNVYDKKLLPQHTIINKINAQLKTIILAHYKKHKLRDTLETFRDQFYINEAIAKLQNNSLTILL